MRPVVTVEQAIKAYERGEIGLQELIEIERMEREFFEGRQVA